MELETIQPNIDRLSKDLEALGNTLETCCNRIAELKYELYIWELDQDETIRTKEDKGTMVLPTGQTIKLTDASRQSLARFPKKEEFAEYESLKRKRDGLELIIKAKDAALRGQQSLSAIVRKQMELV